MTDPVRATLQDVAAAAGVSPKTVSRVVNGERYVAEATAEKVRRAVRELGFRPDQAARTLARGRRFPLAGLLVTTLANPYGVAAMHGVERVLRPAGFSFIIASSNEDMAVERQLFEEFRERGVESLIVVPSGVEHDHLVEAAERMNLVLIHRVIEGLQADSVAPDDFGATRAEMAKLLAAGHRRIAFVGDLEYIYNIRQRIAGFREAHREAGVPVDESLVVFGSRTSESAARATAELLDLADPPTAIFGGNNVNCLGVLMALRLRPERPAVVGFDDLPEAAYLGVPVTLLAYEQAEVGRVAAELLVSRASGARGEPRHVTVPVTTRHVAEDSAVFGSGALSGESPILR